MHREGGGSASYPVDPLHSHWHHYCCCYCCYCSAPASWPVAAAAVGKDCVGDGAGGSLR